MGRLSLVTELLQAVTRQAPKCSLNASTSPEPDAFFKHSALLRGQLPT
jgi:hypothetical protein